MRIAAAAIIIYALLLASGEVQAAPGCPQSADKLQAYYSCLIPMRGTIGMRYGGSLAQLENGGGGPVMAAMQQTAVVPPQAHNGMAGVTNVNPFAPMMGATAYVAATRGNSNPYFWMGAGYATPPVW